MLRHEHRITRTQTRSITRTHTRTHTYTHTVALYAREICLKENAWTLDWTAQYDRNSHVSCAKWRNKLNPNDSANVNVATCIAASSLSAPCFVLCVVHEQETALLSWAELLRHTRRMRNVAERTPLVSFFLCDCRRRAKARRCYRNTVKLLLTEQHSKTKILCSLFEI